MKLIEKYKIQKVIAALNGHRIRAEFGNETTCYAKKIWKCEEKPVRVVLFTQGSAFELCWTCEKHVICPLNYWKEV